MDYQIPETTTFLGEEIPVNIHIMLTGWLAHDNKLWDLQCTQCKKIESSSNHATCPKCGGELDYIRNEEGNPFTISEGTLHPALYKGTKKKWLDVINKYDRYSIPEFRFKVFTNMDNSGSIRPCVDHHNMKKGAIVKIVIVNHLWYSSFFARKKTTKKGVEEMFHIYPSYGDTIEVLKGVEADKVLAVDRIPTPEKLSPPFRPKPVVPKVVVPAPINTAPVTPDQVKLVQEFYTMMQKMQGVDFQAILKNMPAQQTPTKTVTASVAEEPDECFLPEYEVY